MSNPEFVSCYLLSCTSCWFLWFSPSLIKAAQEFILPVYTVCGSFRAFLLTPKPQEPKQESEEDLLWLYVFWSDLKTNTTQVQICWWIQPTALFYPNPPSLIFAFGKKWELAFFNVYIYKTITTISCQDCEDASVEVVDAGPDALAFVGETHWQIAAICAVTCVMRSVDVHLYAFRTSASAYMCARMYMHVSGGWISFAVDCVVEWRRAHLRRFEERSGNSSDIVLL